MIVAAKRACVAAILLFISTPAHAGDCLTDEAVEAALGQQVRAGAFAVDVRALPDEPLCSGISLTKKIQDMRDEAFPEHPEPPPIVAEPAQRSVARAVAGTIPRRRAGSKPQVKAAAGAPYYPSCAAVREAGAAPIRRGDPGYSRRLDRDGDGIACE